MPVIEFRGSESDGEIAELVFIHMVYPNSVELRNQYHATDFVNGFERQGWVEEIPWRISQVLWDAPSREEVKARSKTFGQRGTVAGDVVFNVHQMVCHEMKEPSIQKAIGRVSKNLRPETTRFLDGIRPNFSERAIRKAFEEFRSVSHFWAALLYLLRDDSSGVQDPKDAMLRNLPLVLAVAEEYRHFGERFKSPRQGGRKKTLLDPEVTWKVPRPGCPLAFPEVTLRPLSGYGQLT